MALITHLLEFSARLFKPQSHGAELQIGSSAFSLKMSNPICPAGSRYRTLPVSPERWSIFSRCTWLSPDSPIFSTRRFSSLVFGMTAAPRWTAHDNITWAGDFPHSWAISMIYEKKTPFSLCKFPSKRTVTWKPRCHHHTLWSDRGPGRDAFGFTAATGFPPKGWCAMIWIPSCPQNSRSLCWGRYLFWSINRI